jgi:RNA polymerase sigma-70 factor (ECF subfamily)
LDEADDAAETTNIHLRLELVVEAIDRLPLRCRAIVRLAVLEGYQSGEIAARLCLSESTVRVQLARGVKKCAEFMRLKGECR